MLVWHGMTATPYGYEVFELPWRGCWHYRRTGDEKTTSRCYGSEKGANEGARKDFERWATTLRAVAAAPYPAHAVGDDEGQQAPGRE